MKYISEEIAKEIGFLALNFTERTFFNESYSVIVGGVTIYRDFIFQDLLCSIILEYKHSIEKYKEGVHINIMKNGDIFARNSPYYDGQLEIIPIYNQRKIFNVLKKHLKHKL